MKILKVSQNSIKQFLHLKKNKKMAKTKVLSTQNEVLMKNRFKYKVSSLKGRRFKSAKS